MLEFMDSIVEGVKQMSEWVAYLVRSGVICVAKIIILITTPIWILPYMVMKRVIKK